MLTKLKLWVMKYPVCRIQIPVARQSYRCAEGVNGWLTVHSPFAHIDSIPSPFPEYKDLSTINPWWKGGINSSMYSVCTCYTPISCLTIVCPFLGYWPLAYYTPMTHHTFWPGLWPAPPGAKPSGSVLLPEPSAPDFSTPPAAVWTPLKHSGHCPATGTFFFSVLFLKQSAMAIWPKSQITAMENRHFYEFIVTETIQMFFKLLN